MNKGLAFLGAFLLVALFGAPAFARTEVAFAHTDVACEENYTVTAGD